MTACRFIDEYANFIKRQTKKDIEYQKQYDTPNKDYFIAQFEEKINQVDRILHYVHSGAIIVNEAMLELAKIANEI